MPFFTKKTKLLRQPLRSFRIARFSQALHEWKTLPAATRQTIDNQIAQTIEDLIKAMRPDDPDINDLNNLEHTLFEVLGDDYLRRQTWYWRMEYKRIASESTYAAYLQSAPPDPATAPRPQLVADLQTLIKFLHNEVALEDTREQLINLQMSNSLLGLLIVAYIIVISCAVWLDTIFPWALVMGTLGAFISLQRRIQTLQSTETTPRGLVQLENSAKILLMSMLSGAIFAGILYFLFVSKLVTGTLFPNITISGNEFQEAVKIYPKLNRLKILLGFSSVIDVTEVAKLIVWSFIAGFAEKFVPDILDRLTTSAQQKS